MSGFPGQPDEQTTLELLKGVRAEDSEAWNDLFRRYHDDLLFTVRANLGAKLRAVVDSEDVFQSVALDALKRLHGFEYRGQGSLRHYLHRMVLNKIRETARKQQASKRAGTVRLATAVERNLPGQGTAPDYYQPELYGNLERSMAQLPQDMRQVLLLRRVDGLPSRRVAELMERSDAAVRKLYSRALVRLTTLMTKADRPS